VRKRIVTGLLILAVLGVVAVVLTRPKEGSIAWHKREYLSAYEGSWEQRAEKGLNRLFGKPTPSWPAGRWDLIEKHQRALIELGYLEERKLVLSNRAGNVMAVAANTVRANRSADPGLERLRDTHRFIFVSAPETNTLVIVAPRDDMPVLVEVIRKADVP